MTAPTLQVPASMPARDPVSVVRARAASDVRRLRVLAHAALRDGLPKADLRAANALAAARLVLDHAHRLSAFGRRATDTFPSAEMAD